MYKLIPLKRVDPLRYLASRRRENRLNLIVGMSIVAFMFTMSLVPVMIIVNDLWV